MYRKLRYMKGQNTIILIIVIIMVFIGLIVFLLGVAQKISNEEFMEIYVNSLIVSVMRTDTGYSDSNCKTVSDLVFCAYFTPEWKCGYDSTPCKDLANITISNYMKIFSNEIKSLKYLFIVKPEFISRKDEGEEFTLEIGDKSINNVDSIIYSYPLVISKEINYNQYTLKIQLIVSGKK